MELLISLLLISFTLIGYYFFGKMLNPIMIFVSWSLFLLLLSMWSNIFNSDYFWATYAILIISYIAFTLGSIFGLKFKTIKVREKVVSFKRLSRCISLLSIVVNICIFLYLMDLSKNIGFMQILLNLSGYNVMIQSGFFEGKIYYHILHIAIPLSLFIFYYLLRGMPKHKFFLVLQFIICFLPFISVRRDTLFKMIVLNLLLWYLLSIFKPAVTKFSGNLMRKVKIVLIVITSISFMSATQKLLNKSIEISDMRILGIKTPEFLISPLSYLLGSFPYLNASVVANSASYQGFLISSLRIPYLYIQPILGGSMDLTMPFTLPFLDIGKYTLLTFNTIPIQYYSLIELGFFFPVYYLFLGIISGQSYKKFIKNQGFSETLWIVIIFSLLFWSIREYILIYLSTWIMIVTVIGVSKIVLINKR